MVEATSGNTGIALAMVCAVRGYPFVSVMAESFSIERRRLMRMLGAKVVLTPRAEKGFGMYRKAVELAEANGWFLARQFETEANADIHEATTAREIMQGVEQELGLLCTVGHREGGGHAERVEGVDACAAAARGLLLLRGAHGDAFGLVERGGQCLLCTTTQFSDYVLKLEFQCDKSTNSGIFLRAVNTGASQIGFAVFYRQPRSDPVSPASHVSLECAETPEQARFSMRVLR